MIRNHTSNKEYDEIMYRFPNSNRFNVEVWEWDIKCHSTPYDGRYHLYMLVLKSIHVSERGSCQKCNVSHEQYSMKEKEVNVLKCTNMRLVDINLRHLIGIYKW